MAEQTGDIETQKLVTTTRSSDAEPPTSEPAKEQRVDYDDTEQQQDPAFLVMCLGMQATFLILFAIGGEYLREPTPNAENFSFFQDIHGMLFIGFGFLMTFLRRYSFGGIAFNFLLCATCIQWQLIMFGAICQGWNGSPANETLGWGNKLRKFSFSLTSLAEADMGVLAILISMGAVLGRTNPSQLLMMALIEVPTYGVNFYIVMKYLGMTDTGGSITIHVFGCFFGLAVSYMLGKPENTENCKSMYHSDLFAMIGTLFLWLYFPSFNAYHAFSPTTHLSGQHGLMIDGDRTRAYVNTIISLCASTLATFAFSKIWKNGKLQMTHIQNATLAGGVAMGACADLYTHPAGAVIIGFTAGTVATFGYCYIQEPLANCGIFDTSGVNNVHGMPGILGCIASAITVGSYGDNARFGRNLHFQAAYQIAGLAVTLAISMISGLVTGAIMRYVFTPPQFPFTDVENFNVPTAKAADFFRGTIRGKKGMAGKREENV